MKMHLFALGWMLVLLTGIAQATLFPTTDPARFEGYVFVNGENATNVSILVYVNGVLNKIVTSNAIAYYVATAEGADGSTVSFKVNGVSVNETTSNFTSFSVTHKNLTMTRSAEGAACTAGYSWSNSGCSGSLVCCSDNICRSSCAIAAAASSGGGGGGVCTYDKKFDWGCGEWSACAGGIQARTCKEKNNCGSTYGKPETLRTCQETPASKIPKKLFDITFELDSAVVEKPDKVNARVSFDNFGLVPTRVDLTYTIIDASGAAVYSEKGSVTVETEQLLAKSFESSALEAGRYTLVLKTVYNTNVTDEFRQAFEITEKVVPASSGILESTWTYVIGVVIAFVAFLFYTIYRNKSYPDEDIIELKP